MTKSWQTESHLSSAKSNRIHYRVPWSRPDITKDEIKEVLRVMRSGWLSQGAVTQGFERKLSEYSGATDAIVVNNGTSALLCAFLAHGAVAGDRVLVPDYTHIATANVAKVIGCRVTPVDINPSTFNVDYTLLEHAARKLRPKFVVVVDVAGMSNDMDLLSELATEYEFTLIEDAAESMGAKYKDRNVGSSGNTAILSFHAAKQLTTIEGGAVLTQDLEVADRCRLIRNHGGAGQNYHSKTLGLNFRTTDLQSALGVAQLKKLGRYISRRNQLVSKYHEGLSDLFKFQSIPSYVSRHAHMMFLALAHTRRERDELRRCLEKGRIETRVPWPPIHKQPQFRRADRHFRESSKLYENCISLPLFNSMKDSDVDCVISKVRSIR